MIGCMLFFSMFSFFNKIEHKNFCIFSDNVIEKEYNILEDEYLKKSNIKFSDKIIKEDCYTIEKQETNEKEIVVNNISNKNIDEYTISENNINIYIDKINYAVSIYVNGWINEGYVFESPDEVLADFEIPMTKENYNYTTLKIIEECSKFGFEKEAKELYQNCYIY